MPLQPGILHRLTAPILPRLAQTFTGRVLVRLRPEVVGAILTSYADENELSLETIAQEFTASQLATVLDNLGDPDTSRLVHRWSIKTTNDMEDHVGIPLTRPGRSLNAYFGVDLRGRTLPALLDAVADLRAVPEVESAFVEPAIGLASAVTPDKFMYASGIVEGQGYVGGDHTKYSDRSGVNAEAVWGLYDGSGVKVVVLEEGWKLEHPDLPRGPGGNLLPLLDGIMVNVVSGRDHGTQALGIIAAVDHPGEGDGIVGIAPGVTIPGLASFHYTGGSNWEIVDAIAAAIDALDEGDILLLEVQTIATTVGGVLLPAGYPLEIVDPWLDAIRLATLYGITVIEPAGNPGETDSYDLDLATWTPLGSDPRSLKMGDPTFIDSGAVMVGACKSLPAADDLHDRSDEAWYGSRIDCYAWGDDVLTTSCIGLLLPGTDIAFTCGDGEPAQATYGTFGDSSAAAAIIAGTAALVQHMRKATVGTSASPAQIRAMLRDKDMGTPIGDIGGLNRVMPDLGKLQAGLVALPDVYIRDSLDDVGSVPSPRVSMSPDVFVLNTTLDLSGLTAPYNDWAVSVPNNLVVPDTDNFVYLRISNLSLAADAVGCSATVYWTPPSSLLLPADWREVGRLPVAVDVPADGRVVAGPITWRPTASDLPFGGHGCFIAQLDHPADPRPIPAPDQLSSSDFLSFIGSSNNVAWRNFNVVEPLPLTPGAPPDPAGAWEGAGFFMRGLPEMPMEFDFEISAPKLPDDGALLWRMPAAAYGIMSTDPAFRAIRSVQARSGEAAVPLPLDRPSRFYRVRLPAAARIPMSLGAFLPVGRSLAPSRLVVRQLLRGVEVGRIVWEVRTNRS